jgi:WD40 repeat protein
MQLSSRVAMTGERLDYTSERQRHERVVGRAALLAQLDSLLGGDADRSVVIIGGPGTGKTALLAAWLARQEAAGAVVPHHFIRRQHGWDEPEKLVGSLVAQIEARCPGVLAAADAAMHPAARLGTALRHAARALRPRREHLVVVIDGLDELDEADPADAADPLAAFLPHALPRGVRVLYAGRAGPRASSLAIRSELFQLDLEASSVASDNEAAIRLIWLQAAAHLELDPRYVDEAVVRAGGCVLHAALWQRRLAAVAPDLRRIEDIPRGLSALLAASWQRIAAEPQLADALGILCAAREALTLAELARVAGWTEAPPELLRGAGELVAEIRRAGGEPAYQLDHEAIREHVARAIGDEALRRHHRALAHRLAIWPADGPAQPYALRHALAHRVQAGEGSEVWRLAADTSFVEAKCRALGVHELQADLARAVQRCRDYDARRRLRDLAAAIGREARWLRAAPDAAAAVVWNRLRRSGWSAADLDAELHPPRAFLRVRHAIAGDNPARVRELVGHTAGVQACAVTPDGRQVVSASADGTLKLWDLERGHLRRTFVGHAGPVWGCAVTGDRRVVSASADGTLKLWSLDSGQVLATLASHRDEVLACAVMPDGQRVVSASADGTLKVWELASGRWLGTFEGHTGRVTACAADLDDHSVVSASADGTVRRWSLDGDAVDIVHDEHGHPVTACTVTARGHLVLASADATLKVRLRANQPLQTLRGHTGAIHACATTENYLISASEDRTVKIWLPQGLPIPFTTLLGHGEAVTACAVSPDGRHVISGARDGTLRIWELAWRDALAGRGSDARSLRACAVTADGRRMVSVCDDLLQIRDIETAQVVATQPLDDGRARGVAVTAETWSMISAANDATLCVEDLDSRSAHAIAKSDTRATAGPSMLSSWRVIIGVDDEAADPSEGRTRAILAYVSEPTACAASATGERAVTASEDGTVRLWDLATARMAGKLEVEGGHVLACAVTADGRRVVTLSSGGLARIWDVPGARLVATLAGHAGPVTACVLARWERRVVSASEDRTLRIWDLDDGRELAVLEGHAGPVTACVYVATSQCRRVISASEDRTLRIWDLDTSACLWVHRGEAPYTLLAASATVIVAHDSTGAVWILDWPRAPAGPPRGGGWHAST